MYSKKYNTDQKQIYFKAYQNLSQLEIALNRIEKEDTAKIQMSILGKVSQYYLDKEKDIPNGIDVIKVYWKKVWGNKVRLGRFYNPEIGNVFVVGGLASTFLHKVDGKSLATLSSGPYGILRGMGVNENMALTYLKTLNSGKYLLILRAYEADFWDIEYILEDKLKRNI
jgi:hypothetical protein